MRQFALNNFNRQLIKMYKSEIVKCNITDISEVVLYFVNKYEKLIIVNEQFNCLVLIITDNHPLPHITIIVLVELSFVCFFSSFFQNQSLVIIIINYV